LFILRRPNLKHKLERNITFNLILNFKMEIFRAFKLLVAKFIGLCSLILKQATCQNLKYVMGCLAPTFYAIFCMLFTEYIIVFYATIAIK
jgi:hypothetical protein